MGIESTIDTPLAAAVRHVGSQSAFARLIGKNQSTVYEWLRDRRALPAELAIKVEEQTGISRTVLRPDLFTPDSPAARPAGLGDLEPAR